jgi:acyl carrier protein
MIKTKVKEVMASVFEIDVKDIHDDASQKNLSVWDSLQHLNLSVELEDAFDVSFEPEEIGDMTSLDKIVATIKKLKA